MSLDTRGDLNRQLDRFKRQRDFYDEAVTGMLVDYLTRF